MSQKDADFTLRQRERERGKNENQKEKKEKKNNNNRSWRESPLLASIRNQRQACDKQQFQARLHPPPDLAPNSFDRLVAVTRKRSRMEGKMNGTTGCSKLYKRLGRDF